MKTRLPRFASSQPLTIVWRNKRHNCLKVLGSITQSERGRNTYRDDMFTAPARIEIEGLGVNGVIVSIISGYTVLLGEIIRDNCTGRTIIWVLDWVHVDIDASYRFPPMAVRFQAVKIASLKYFSERRST